MVAEEARDLLGGPLVRPRRLHHLVEQADVERDDRDRRRGLRDQRLVDAHVGRAAHARRQQRGELRRRLLQIFLGPPDRPRTVDGERQRRADVAVGDGAAAGRQQIGVRQRAHPGGEVFAPHDLAGRLHLGVGGGRDLDRHHLLVAEVDALAAERLAERLQDRAVADAVGRIDALWRRQTVDDEVELPAGLFEPRNRLVLDLTAEGVAVDDRDLTAGGARAVLGRRQVVPAGRRRLLALRRPLQTDRRPLRAVPEHRAQQAGEAVAGAAADHQRRAEPGAGGALLGDRDLGVDVGGTTGRMGVEADEPADTGGDDLAGHRAFLPAPRRKVKRDGRGLRPADPWIASRSWT